MRPTTSALSACKFLLDGSPRSASEDTTSPYSISWNTTTAIERPACARRAGTRCRKQQYDVADRSRLRSTTKRRPAPSSSTAGAAATNSTTVTLTLSATDALTSVTQMRFSNHGTSYSAAEAFASTKAWTLTSGAGTKTVYVQFRTQSATGRLRHRHHCARHYGADDLGAHRDKYHEPAPLRSRGRPMKPRPRQVDYGLDHELWFDDTLIRHLVTSHSVALTGLAPSTTYNYPRPLERRRRQ